MEQKIEELLSAWVRLSMAISNERLVSDMPFNEAVICHILYQNHLRTPQQPLTATDLCRATKMLKSQMNRTLLSMEDKGLIVRKRSLQDKRQIFISLNLESDLYRAQHQKTLAIARRLITEVGIERTDEITQLFTIIAETAEEIMQ